VSPPIEPRHDTTIIGWPWIDRTFSWVEPTAWCMLALKRAARRGTPTAEARVAEAERLIVNRACESGGWNYGTSYTLGQDLRAYVPTTALALIAMQDRREHPVVRKGLEFLVANRLSEPSGMALTLTALCLDIYGRPSADVKDRLIAQADRTEFLSNLQSAAMALYALTADQHGIQALRL
jgi:hypothetical protein